VRASWCVRALVCLLVSSLLWFVDCCVVFALAVSVRACASCSCVVVVTVSVRFRASIISTYVYIYMILLELDGRWLCTIRIIQFVVIIIVYIARVVALSRLARSRF